MCRKPVIHEDAGIKSLDKGLQLESLLLAVHCQDLIRGQIGQKQNINNKPLLEVIHIVHVKLWTFCLSIYIYCLKHFVSRIKQYFSGCFI